MTMGRAWLLGKVAKGVKFGLTVAPKPPGRGVTGRGMLEREGSGNCGRELTGDPTPDGRRTPVKLGNRGRWVTGGARGTVGSCPPSEGNCGRGVTGEGTAAGRKIPGNCGVAGETGRPTGMAAGVKKAGGGAVTVVWFRQLQGLRVVGATEKGKPAGYLGRKVVGGI